MTASYEDTWSPAASGKLACAASQPLPLAAKGTVEIPCPKRGNEWNRHKWSHRQLAGPCACRCNLHRANSPDYKGTSKVASAAMSEPRKRKSLRATSTMTAISSRQVHNSLILTSAASATCKNPTTEPRRPSAAFRWDLRTHTPR